MSPVATLIDAVTQGAAARMLLTNFTCIRSSYRPIRDIHSPLKMLQSQPAMPPFVATERIGLGSRTPMRDEITIAAS